MSKIVAIVPAKGSSERVSGKNMRLLGGKPLVQIKVEQLLACKNIDEVVVGSDCTNILALSASLGASTRERSNFHCDESLCSANDMIADLVSKVSADIIVWAHCTNPFVDTFHFEQALAFYQKALQEDYDSIFSATKLQGHFWSAHKNQYKPINFTPLSNPHQTAKTVPPLFAQDGAIFIQPHANMRANSYFYGTNPLPFEIPAMVGWDINTEEDWQIAETLIEQKKSINS